MAPLPTLQLDMCCPLKVGALFTWFLLHLPEGQLLWRLLSWKVLGPRLVFLSSTLICSFSFGILSALLTMMAQADAKYRRKLACRAARAEAAGQAKELSPSTCAAALRDDKVSSASSSCHRSHPSTLTCSEGIVGTFEPAQCLQHGWQICAVLSGEPSTGSSVSRHLQEAFCRLQAVQFVSVCKKWRLEVRLLKERSAATVSSRRPHWDIQRRGPSTHGMISEMLRTRWWSLFCTL